MPEGTCSTPDCGRPVRSRGACESCYKRAARGGRLDELDPWRLTCTGCDVVFEPASNRQRYCTRACRKRHQDQRPDVQVCTICGEEFTRGRRVASTCSDTCRARRHYLANAESVKEATRQWRQSNADRRKAHGRAGYARNREAYAERYAAKRAANPEVMRAQNAMRARKWRAANPLSRRATEWRRRHAIRDHPDSKKLTKQDWIDLVNRFHGCCAYCGDRTEDLHLEHVIPVSRGGRHAIGNVLPACPRCNQSKTDFLLIEWRLRCRRRGHPLRGIGDLDLARQAA